MKSGEVFSLDALVADALAGAGVEPEPTTQPPPPRVLEALVGGHFSFVVTPFGEVRLLSVGDEAKALFGVAEAWEESTPERLWVHVHPDDRSMFWRELKTGGLSARQLCCELRVETDTPRWLECRAMAVREQNDVVWHVGVRDITRERQLEAQVAKLQHHQTRGALAAGLTHNFKNVLAVILPNLQQCRAMVAPELHPFLDDALEATHAATTLVTGLLKTRGTEVEGEPVRVSPAFAVHEVGTICRQAFDPKVDIHVDIKGRHQAILATPGELEMVLLNLCINARDAMRGVSSPRLTLRLRSTAADRRILIEVQDNGTGMSEAVLARIGEPFFTTKPQGQGTGLGLATAWSTVRRLGGDMSCQSQLGRGTTFTISLPRHEDAVEEEEEGNASGIVRQGHKPRLLVVDDEELVRRAMNRVISRAGVDVIEAEDARTALATLAEVTVDLVLLDLGLPDMPGEELMTELRRLYPELPIIVATGYHCEPTELGEATAVMAKPLQNEEVVATVHALLAGA